MKNKEKGITLIALIITIIVMLILVGVTINVALNGGLFEKTKNASGQTQLQTDKEALYSAVVAAMEIDGRIDYIKLNQEAVKLGFTKVQDGVYTKDGYTYTVNELTGIVTASKETSGSGEISNFEIAQDNSYFTYSGTGETIIGLSNEGKAFVTESAGKNIKLIIPDKNPENVTIIAIGDYAFINMDTHESLFSGIEGLKIELPNSVTNIGDYCFAAADCLVSIKMPEVTDVGESAFYYCTSLSSIVMPKATVIGEEAFGSCTGLNSVSMPQATSIKSYVFQGCTSLANIIIPNSVTSIGECAFQECTSLINIAIPNSVTSIETSAFEECTSLVKIEIPQTVTSMGRTVFRECTALTDIYCPGNISKPEGWNSEWNFESHEEISATVHWNTAMPIE